MLVSTPQIIKKKKRRATEVLPVKPAKKKKSRKSLPAEPELEIKTEVSPEKPKKSKRKKRAPTPPITFSVKEEPIEEEYSGEFVPELVPELSPEKKEPIEDEKPSILMPLIKEEPVSPVKIKTEPPDFTTLFNSNIKQELAQEVVRDAVDVEICKKLSFRNSDACIHTYNTTLHCAVPPAYVSNIRNGIKAQLKTLHLKFVEAERGVLLRYTNIRLSHQTARIVSIAPELHFDVSCLVTVFRPRIGAVFSGRVVKVGPGYVNCLVYGYFSAVVYNRFPEPPSVGSEVRFRLHFVQVSVDNNLILKGSPV